MAGKTLLFDAISYLRKIDPTQLYTVDTLTGGIMNVTIRATKSGVNAERGRFPNHASMVLKYTPHFVAGMGEDFPLTTYRQQIEAQALSLFSAEGSNTLKRVCDESLVSVPALLHHDSEAHVLIMSDLGPLDNVASMFSSLVGYIGPSDMQQLEPNILATPDINSEEEALSYFTAIGSRLGSFFAKLHSHHALSAVVHDPQRGPNFFECPELRAFAFESAVAPVEENLRRFPHLLSAPEAAVLYKRILNDCTEAVTDDTRSLSLTDCWPGALLVSPRDASIQAGPEIGVVDWEFADVGRGLDGDMAQLLGQFAMMECAANCEADAVQGQRLRALTRAISKSYCAVSVEEGSIWTADSEVPSKARFAPLNAQSARAKMLRSAFLKHGSEIMHWALVKPWKCRNPACMIDTGHTTIKYQCLMVQSMVERAIWYLRHAKDDLEKFCSAENCLAMQRAHEDGRWLLDFFAPGG